MNGFDPGPVRAAIAAHGPVVRVVVAAVAGSTPREAGAAMLVWDDGQAGTIGGGALEHDATRQARRLLTAGGAWLRQVIRYPLGPALGQCCGGAVTLVLERLGPAEAAGLPAPGSPFLRPLASGQPPLAAEPGAALPGGVALLAGDLLHEPAAPPDLPVWLYGAGHVGRAIVAASAQCGLAITWVDVAADRFPAVVPSHAQRLLAAEPWRAVAHAPDDAVHLVMTHSHALDLEICDKVLARNFGQLGLIGSATKRARFLARLAERGHPPERLARLDCPIGDRRLGKRPGAIALGVLTGLMLTAARAPARLAG